MLSLRRGLLAACAGATTQRGHPCLGSLLVRPPLDRGQAVTASTVSRDLGCAACRPGSTLRATAGRGLAARRTLRERRLRVRPLSRVASLYGREHTGTEAGRARWCSGGEPVHSRQSYDYSMLGLTRGRVWFWSVLLSPYRPCRARPTMSSPKCSGATSRWRCRMRRGWPLRREVWTSPANERRARRPPQSSALVAGSGGDGHRDRGEQQLGGGYKRWGTRTATAGSAARVSPARSAPASPRTLLPDPTQPAGWLKVV